jgi:RHS repeat-associated protein
MSDATGGNGTAPSDRAKRSYVYGSYIDEVVAFQTTVGGVTKRYYPHYNSLYSVAALTGGNPEDSGQVVERYSYDANGTQTITSGGGAVRSRSAYSFDRSFTGYIKDEETGLLYARSRMYSPRLGRFIDRMPWMRTTRFIMSNYHPILVDAYYLWIVNRYFKYTYQEGRYNLYDYAMGNSGRFTEPFSPYPPGTNLWGGPIPGWPGSVPPAQPPAVPPTNPGIEQPPLPPVGPPGVSIDQNMEDAQNGAIGDPPANPLWFRDKVKNKGPWDYKQQGSQYEDFGNYNYGATGCAFGFPLGILLQEAGRAQTEAGTSRPEWGSPGTRGCPSTGTGSYGDDPEDQEQIKRGYRYSMYWKFMRDVKRTNDELRP